MKRTTSFLLLLTLILLLSACGNSQTTPLPAQFTGSGPAGLPLETPIELGDSVELRFLDGFASSSVSSPVDNVFSPPAGEEQVWVVLYTEIRYSGESECKLSELFEAELRPENSAAVKGSLSRITGEGENNSYGSLLPLETGRAYIAFQVPGACVDGSFDLKLSASRGEVFSAAFTLAQLEQARPRISVGDTVGNDSAELTLEGLYFTKKQTPSSPNYRYYYAAPEGMVYYVVKMSVKNCGGTRLSFDEIGAAKLIYQDKYQYDGYWVHETRSRESLEAWSGSLDPLESRLFYYLISVPEEVQNGPIAVTLFAAGRFYTCVIPEAPAPTPDGEA